MILGFIIMKLQLRHEKTVKLLSDREEKFSAMTRAANDAIIMMNENGAITFWNPAAEKVFGYTENDILGKPLHQILAPPRYLDSTFEKGLLRWQRDNAGTVIGNTIEVSALRSDGTEFRQNCLFQIYCLMATGSPWALCAIYPCGKRNERYQRSIQHLLEIVALDVDLYVSLSNIALFVESMHPDTYCSIMLADEEQNYLYNAAAPTHKCKFSAYPRQRSDKSRLTAFRCSRCNRQAGHH